MKRENLFRGKEIKTGKWVEGYYYASPLGSFILPRGYEISVTLDSIQVIPETIGQFTGASDAEINGREVFDGDIIQNCDTRLLQEVYYDEDRFAWYCRYLYDKQQIVSLRESLGNLNKVYGNIHDNPELLK